MIADLTEEIVQTDWINTIDRGDFSSVLLQSGGFAARLAGSCLIEVSG